MNDFTKLGIGLSIGGFLIGAFTVVMLFATFGQQSGC